MWTLLDILSILCNLLDCRGSHERTTLSAVPKCNSASEQVLSGRYMQSEIFEQLRQARLMAIMLVQLRDPSSLLAQQHMSSCMGWACSLICGLSFTRLIGAEEVEVAEEQFCILVGESLRLSRST